MRSILLFICILFALPAFADTKDSVGIKRVNDKDFVEHVVDKGQTLYSLSRRYKVTVAEIMEQNPELAAGLKVGQVLLIPVKKTAGSVAEKPLDKPVQKPAVEKPKPPVVTAVEKDTSKYIYHEVLEGETMLNIAKTYKTYVYKIREWNKLSNESVSPGQVLIVGLKAKAKVDPKAKKGKPDAKPADEGGEKNEQGKAGAITDPMIDQQRNFCFHPDAPIGTIIMVTNPANNQSVFVSVKGNYPADGTTIIQLSQAAMKKLGSSNPGFDVSINYRR